MAENDFSEVAKITRKLKIVHNNYKAALNRNSMAYQPMVISHELRDSVSDAVGSILDHPNLEVDNISKFREEVYRRVAVIENAINTINEGIVANPLNLPANSVQFNAEPVKLVSLDCDNEFSQKGMSAKDADDEWVNINVKGVSFTTTKGTMTKHFPNSHLARIFKGEVESEKDENGAYMLRADPDYFREILNYLRRRKFCVPEHHLRGLAADARKFGLNEMAAEIETLREIAYPPVPGFHLLQDIPANGVYSPYKCTVCKGLFSTPVKCEKHFRSYHQNICKFCGQRFVFECELKKHSCDVWISDFGK